MEKLPMCRICLVQNVRMYLVVNRNLHELYEKLTDIPFVTEDRRPILACFFCFAKLKQCCQLLRKCLEAEELFARMRNEDYEPKPSIKQEYLGGFIKSPIENISIVDVVQSESIAIKEELPAVCEGPDDIIEPKEECQSNGLLTEVELENLDNSCLDVADMPPHYSESYLDYGVQLMEFKTEVSKKKRRTREMNSATVAKKPKLDARRTKQADAITAEQMKREKSDLKVIQTTQKRTSEPGTSKEPYKCDQRSSNRVKKNTQHTRTQIGKNTYKCDICLRSYRCKSSLIKHIRLHSGEKPYKCDVSQRSFSQKIILTQHIRIHTGEKPYKCDVCLRSFSQKGNFILHKRRHTGEKPYKCDICQRSFSEKGCLTKHTRIHTGEKPYKCDVCVCSFNEKGGLTQHIRKHTGEKPYKCDVCPRSFSQKTCLKIHIRIHTGEKPYKCDICQRSFSQKAPLTQHIRIHTGEKPYKCDVCQRSFSRKNNCTKHVRMHTADKPYK